MSETNLPSSRNNKAAIAAIIAFVVIGFACIAAFTATAVILIDAIPFHHLFPH